MKAFILRPDYTYEVKEINKLPYEEVKLSGENIVRKIGDEFSPTKGEEVKFETLGETDSTIVLLEI